MKNLSLKLVSHPLLLMSLCLLLFVTCRAFNTGPDPVVGVRLEATATTTPTSLSSPTNSPSAASLMPTSAAAAYTATPTATTTPQPTATSTTPTATATAGPTSLPILTAVLEDVPVVGQIGGYTGAVAVRDNYAYMGVGPRLVVLDVSQPAQPIFVGQSPLLPAVPQAITLTSTFAYVASRNGNLTILDVADPADPRWLGAYIEDGAPWNSSGRNVNMALAGNVAYIIGGDRGILSIIDVSDPANPVGLGYYEPPGGDGRGVAIRDNDAYVAAGEQGLLMVDVSDPAHPAEVASLPGHAWDVAISGNTAYVADGHSRLRILDLADPRRPAQINSYQTDEMAVNQVLVEGNTVYISDKLGTEGTYTIFYQYGPQIRPGNFQIIDVDNPRNPILAGAYQTPAQIWSLAVAGKSAYVASGDLHIIDVAEPAEPEEVGLYRTPGEVFDVVVTGNHAYVAAGNRGLGVLNVTDPANPVEVGSQIGTPGHALRLLVVGDTAYVTNDWRAGTFADPIAGGLGLRIVNVSDPAAPVEVGFYRISDRSPFVLNDLAAAGNYLYLAKWDGLQILDLTNPAAPVEVSTVPIPAQGITVVNNYAYVTGEQGLTILDVANPAAPVEVSSGYTGYRVLCIFAQKCAIVTGQVTSCSTTYQAAVKHIFAVENDVFPPNRTDVFQQAEVNVGRFWITFLYHPANLFGLPVDNAGHNNCEAIAGIELSL